jgi:hypothetical protein
MSFKYFNHVQGDDEEKEYLSTNHPELLGYIEETDDFVREILVPGALLALLLGCRSNLEEDLSSKQQNMASERYHEKEEEEKGYTNFLFGGREQRVGFYQRLRLAEWCKGKSSEQTKRASERLGDAINGCTVGFVPGILKEFWNVIDPLQVQSQVWGSLLKWLSSDGDIEKDAIDSKVRDVKAKKLEFLIWTQYPRELIDPLLDFLIRVAQVKPNEKIYNPKMGLGLWAAKFSNQHTNLKSWFGRSNFPCDFQGEEYRPDYYWVTLVGHILNGQETKNLILASPYVSQQVNNERRHFDCVLTGFSEDKSTQSPEDFVALLQYVRDILNKNGRAILTIPSVLHNILYENACVLADSGLHITSIFPLPMSDSDSLGASQWSAIFLNRQPVDGKLFVFNEEYAIKKFSRFILYNEFRAKFADCVVTAFSHLVGFKGKNTPLEEFIRDKFQDIQKDISKAIDWDLFYNLDEELNYLSPGFGIGEAFSHFFRQALDENEKDYILLINYSLLISIIEQYEIHSIASIEEKRIKKLLCFSDIGDVGESITLERLNKETEAVEENPWKKIEKSIRKLSHAKCGKLGDIAQIFLGINNDNEDENGREIANQAEFLLSHQIPSVKTFEADRKGYSLFHIERSRETTDNIERYQGRSRYRLKEGDVVITSLDGELRMGLVSGAMQGLLVLSDVIVVRFQRTYNSKFFFRLFQSLEYRRVWSGFSAKEPTYLQQIKRFKNLPIPILKLEVFSELRRFFDTPLDWFSFLQEYDSEEFEDANNPFAKAGFKSFLLTSPVLKRFVSPINVGKEIYGPQSISVFLDLEISIDKLNIYSDLENEDSDYELDQITELIRSIIRLIELALKWPRGFERWAKLERLKIKIIDLNQRLHAGLGNVFGEDLSLLFLNKQLIIYLIGLIEYECMEIVKSNKIDIEVLKQFIVEGQTELLVRVENNGLMPLENFKLAVPEDIVKIPNQRHDKEITELLGEDIYKIIDNIAYGLGDRNDVSIQDGQERFIPGETLILNLNLNALPPGRYTREINWRAKSFYGEGIGEKSEITFHVFPSDSSIGEDDELGPSPYIAGPPIDRPEMFFGRKKTLAEISQQIYTEKRANLVLLQGNKRTGKSSILRYIEKKQIRNENVSVIPVYFSLHSMGSGKDNTNLSDADFFKSLAGECALSLLREGYIVSIPGIGTVKDSQLARFEVRKAINRFFGGDRPFELFRILLDLWIDQIKPKRFVLMIDEFDRFREEVASVGFDRSLILNLRFLFENHTNLAGIITGSRLGSRQYVEEIASLLSFSYRIGLDPLEEEEALALVQKPVENKLIYKHSVAEDIVDECARQPFLIQVLCNKIFNCCVQMDKRYVSPEILSIAIEEMTYKNEHFQSLWEQVGNARRQYLICLIDELQKERGWTNLERLIDTLQEREFIYPRSLNLEDDLSLLVDLEIIKLTVEQPISKYEINIPLMSRWLNRHFDRDAIKRTACKEMSSGD